MADIFNIAGQIHSTSEEQTAVVASEVKDEQMDKKQNVINQEVDGQLNTPTTGLEDRVHALEQGATGSGDVEIETNPSGVVAGSGKVTTANAVRGAIDMATGYFECATAAATVAKVITGAAVAGFVLPTIGGSFKVKFAHRNSAANPTLNINATGSKAIYYNGQPAGAGNTWDDNETVVIFYDGTNYQANNVAGNSGDGVFDISVYNAVEGTPATYADLAAALGTNGANVPVSGRKGGMSIKFVNSITGQYEQYRLMSATWSTAVSDWQGMDSEPVFGGKNLLESGAVFTLTDEFCTDVIYNVADYSINTNGTFGTSDSYHHAEIKVNAGERYLIKNIQDVSDPVVRTKYVFATSDGATSGGQIPIVSGCSVVSVPINKGYLVEIPEGCEWLLVSYGISYPLSVKGYALINSLNLSGIPWLFVEDSCINKNGVFVEKTDYQRSLLIPLVAGKAFNIIVANASTIAGFYVYDELGKPAGEVTLAGTGTIVCAKVNTSDVLTTYPSAKYFAISGYNHMYELSMLSVAEPIVGLNNLRETMKSNLDYIQVMRSMLPYHINHSGNVGTLSSYEHSYYMPVIPGRSYSIHTYYSSENIAAVYLYDANFEPLEEYVFPGKLGNFSAILNADDILTQCPTAKYFRISAYKDKGYIEGLNITDSICLANNFLNSINANIDSKTSVLQSEIDDVNEDIGMNSTVVSYDSGDFYGVAYNTNKKVFVDAGPTTNGILIPLNSGKEYKIGKISYICTEVPTSGKNSEIISRVIGANTRFIAEEGELYAHVNISVSSFITLEETMYGYGIKHDVEVVSGKVDTIEKELTLITDSAEIKHEALKYDTLNKYREQELRQKYWDKVNNEDYVGKWYGVEWLEEDDADNVTPINSTGDSSLHSTLPIQSKMRRCVTKDNVIQYYLNAENSELKTDGTAAHLDGTDGDVMVEISEFFYKIEEEMVNNTRKIRIKISEDALPDFLFSPRRYTSAYEATINRETGHLASVCTTNFTRTSLEAIQTASSNSYVKGTSYNRGNHATARRNGHTLNAATYRGGTNDDTYDSYEDPSEEDYSRNQLGLPVANINRRDIREACDTNQFGYLYDTQRILYMLIQTEFKTRNIQSSVLGKGATVYPSYSAYESFFAPQGGISVLPCGITNSLGNNSGEVYYLMENVPISQSGSGDEITYTFDDVWMPCMSYRGVEHYYGHIYKIADQVDCVTSSTTGYVDGHSGDVQYSLHDVSWWYEKNPYLAKLSIKSDKNYLGTWNFPCHIMTVSSLLMGKYGHVLHIGASGKDYTKNYCDCSELDAKAGKTKYITFNGRIVSGNLVGNHFIVAFNTIEGGDARPSDGTRLDHF